MTGRALSGVRLGFMPLEELMFAFAFGTCWSGVYEHVHWSRSIRPTRRMAPGPESAP